MTTAAARELHPPVPQTTARYIVAPLYDAVFFVGAPLLGLLFAALVFVFERQSGQWVAQGRFAWSLQTLVLGQVFTHAHIFLVFFRSHARRELLRQHRLRFTLVPGLVLAALMFSETLLVIGVVLGFYWDLYHSGMQTFGLGRIYDRRAGNDVAAGRRWDIALNLFLYLGPALCGANLIYVLSGVQTFENIDWRWLATLPARLAPYAAAIRAVIVTGAGAFAVAYALAYAKLARRGYRFSGAKTLLLLNTGICGVVAWAFLPTQIAMLVVNFFHAWQYFGIVWWSERGNLSQRFGTPAPVTFAIVILVTFAYGLMQQKASVIVPLFAFVTTCSLMHFWYDGFIWSVRKQQV